MPCSTAKSSFGGVESVILARFAATIVAQSTCLMSKKPYCSAQVRVKTSKFDDGVFAVG
jgi:hypothetical protein